MRHGQKLSLRIVVERSRLRHRPRIRLIQPRHRHRRQLPKHRVRIRRHVVRPRPRDSTYSTARSLGLGRLKRQLKAPIIKVENRKQFPAKRKPAYHHRIWLASKTLIQKSTTGTKGADKVIRYSSNHALTPLERSLALHLFYIRLDSPTKPPTNERDQRMANLSA